MTSFRVEPEPPAELLSFAKRQARNWHRHTDVDRRTEKRHVLVAPVLAQPVDEAYRATGDRFALVSRDISSKGFGLVHSGPIDEKLLAIQTCIAGEDVTAVVEVLWCEPFGPFEYIGTRIVARLTDLPDQEGR